MSKRKEVIGLAEKPKVKIHLDKFLAKNEVNWAIEAILKAKYRSEMHTESEWKKIIENELKRKIS